MSSESFLWVFRSRSTDGRCKSGGSKSDDKENSAPEQETRAEEFQHFFFSVLTSAATNSNGMRRKFRVQQDKSLTTFERSYNAKGRRQRRSQAAKQQHIVSGNTRRAKFLKKKKLMKEREKFRRRRTSSSLLSSSSYFHFSTCDNRQIMKKVSIFPHPHQPLHSTMLRSDLRNQFRVDWLFTRLPQGGKVSARSQSHWMLAEIKGSWLSYTSGAE